MKYLQFLFFTLIFSAFAHAEFQFSGFASVVGGKTISGDGDLFLADYPLVGLYGDELNFQPETAVGFQARADLEDGLSFTAQWIARGLDGFNSEVNYAYLSYELTDDLTIQAGRKRLPLQFYSEFFDVGFAYPWIRPPVDLYTWQILNYNGFNLIHKSIIGEGALSTSFYMGREESRNNKLLSQFFFSEATDEIWKDIVGVSLDYSINSIQALLSYTNFTEDTIFTTAGTARTSALDKSIDFIAAAINYDPGQYFILSELNSYEGPTFKAENWLLSLGYRHNELTPYISLSSFNQKEKIANEPLEEHSTTSVGLRWNFHYQAAFKVQYDDIKDEGTIPVVGDAQAITFGVDLIF